MQQVPYNKNAQKNLDIIAKGAFLTTQHDGKLNTMTIAWASISHVWQRPVFVVYVRPARYTYDLLEKSGEFTVSVPYGNMQQALAICGTKSGRDIDKFAICQLPQLASSKIKTPALNIAGMHFECKVIYKTPMDLAALDEAPKEYYPKGDSHTIYFGEILNTVEIE